MSLIDDIAAAIKTKEGWYPGSRAYRNNNPGNLNSGPRMTGQDAGGYAVYATVDDGMLDLKRQITLNVDRGLTLGEFFQGKPGVYRGYAPSNDPRGANDPKGYALFVSGRTGIPLDAKLNNVVGKLSEEDRGNGNDGSSSPSGMLYSSVSTGEDVSSDLAMDMFNGSGISFFDSEGNFAPSPFGWIIGIAGLGLVIGVLK